MDLVLFSLSLHLCSSQIAKLFFFFSFIFQYHSFESSSRLLSSLEELECGGGDNSACNMPQLHEMDYQLNVSELNEKHIKLDIQVIRNYDVICFPLNKM